MKAFDGPTRKKGLLAAVIIVSIGLCISAGLNVYFSLAYIKGESYLQTTDEIYIMEAGILRNNLAFYDGVEKELHYDFNHESYETLKSQYQIESTAKDGTEFERARRLMQEYAPRLTHESHYDNHIPINALDLLDYSLDNAGHGINCRNKAQILNEMCLALGIYARKVWIYPYSGYDNDCHVVNEIWDSSLGKWIMLDITNNEYWVDENNAPLSVLEIRSKAAANEFCTPVAAGDRTDNLPALQKRHIGDYLYIVKNLVYMSYCTEYTAGEGEELCILLPKNIPTASERLISQSSIEKAPGP